MCWMKNKLYLIKLGIKKVLHTAPYYNNIGISETPLLWEIARNSLSGPGLCCAEWQMIRFKVLLLAVMRLLSISHIHLAGILCTLQSNSINICKLDLEVLYMIYFNKIYIAELQCVLTASHLGHLLRKILWPAFFPFSLILKLCSQTADLPFPPSLPPALEKPNTPCVHIA